MTTTTNPNLPGMSRREQDLLHFTGVTNFTELVQTFFGPCDKNEADQILWNCTSFPFVSIDHVIRQLTDISERSNVKVLTALHLSKADEIAILNS